MKLIWKEVTPNVNLILYEETSGRVYGRIIGAGGVWQAFFDKTGHLGDFVSVEYAKKAVEAPENFKRANDIMKVVSARP
jgi:hypothetical protein